MSQELKIKAVVDARSATAELKALLDGVRSVSSQMDRSTTSSKNFNTSINSLTKGLRSYISAYALISGMREAVTSLKELESGFIGVQKTTNLAGQEFDSFKEGLLDLATKLKGVDVKELQTIATTAGQLGVSGREDLLAFSEAIAKIAVATDLTAEQASEGMAVFTNIMGEPITETARLGSVMNELSNTSTATASDILEFSKRMAGAGKTLGLTSHEVMGLSATLKDIGVRIEGGGTAMSRLMGLMIQDTQAFADESGKSLEQYMDDINTKPIKAIQDLIKELSKLDKFKRMEALERLGITSEETVAVMLKLTTAQGKLTKNLNTAKKEYTENTSLQKEYEIASKSLEASIKDLHDSFQQLLLTIGEDLLPWLKEQIKTLSELVVGTKEFYKENKVLVQTLMDLVILAGELYVFKRALYAIIGAEAVAGLSVTRKGVEGLRDGFVGLRTAIIAVSTLPAVALFGGLAVAVAGVLTYVNTVEEASNKYKKTIEEFINVEKDSVKSFANMAEAMANGSEFINMDTEDLTKNRKALEDAIKYYEKFIEMHQPTKEIIDSMEVEVMSEYSEEVKTATARVEKFKAMLNETSALKPIGTDYAEIMTTYGSAVDKTNGTIKLTILQHEQYVKTIIDTMNANEDKIASLEKEYTSLEKNKTKIEELRNANERYRKILEEVATLSPIVAGAQNKLNKEQQKFIDKTKEDADQRLKTAKNTAVEIANRETKLFQELTSLEEELAKKRQEFANERLNSRAKAEEKLYNASQQGKDDYQKYVEDGLRFEEKVAKAKEALASGNVELFKTYYAEAQSLADNNAGAEIKVTEEVYAYKEDRANKFTNAELKRRQASEESRKGDSLKARELLEDAYKLEQEANEKVKTKVEETKVTKEEAYKAYESQINALFKMDMESIELRKKAEIDSHNEKIEMKKIELEAVKAELEAQMQILRLLVEISETTKGVKFAVDFKNAEKSIANIEEKIKAVENSKREYKLDTTAGKEELVSLLHYGESVSKKLSTPISIKTETEDAKKKLDTLGKLKINGKTVVVTADTTPADFGVKKLSSKIEGDSVSITLSPEWKDAENKLYQFRHKEEGQEIEQNVVITSSDAEKKIAEINKPTESSHRINLQTAEVEATISNIQKDTKSTHNIGVDATLPVNAISMLSRDTSSTHTVFVRTVEQNSTGGEVGRFAEGGFLRRSGAIPGHDIHGSDDVKAMLTRGEFVQNVKAVDYYGVDFMKKINSISIPRASLPSYSTGGMVSDRHVGVSGVQRFATGGLVGGSKSSSGTVNVNLNVGGNTFPMISEESVAIALSNFLARGEF